VRCRCCGQGCCASSDLESRVPGLPSVFVGSKVRAQEIDRFADHGLVHDRTFSDSFGYTRGAVAIRVQRPHNIVSILALIPFVERERFEDQNEAVSSRYRAPLTPELLRGARGRTRRSASAASGPRPAVALAPTYAR
jgi:hypothetical protein